MGVSSGTLPQWARLAEGLPPSPSVPFRFSQEDELVLTGPDIVGRLV